ncbi:Uncharacterized protein FWK35_00021704 [Aphis craccivora]|uniref:Integrase catalytic domain-containing protein n=1 Tax=Aphis craccivora TaxID=307492 RepID=A0A6G0WYT3_APHCR|nr:Uncharacterized protein FWK35_00021704 [Aphis craccivora]
MWTIHHLKVTPTKGYVCVFACHQSCPFGISQDVAKSLTYIVTIVIIKSFKKASKFKKDSKIHEFLAVMDITWYFIPSSSPHFGGLLESAFKSAKMHLYCISKDDETTTLLCQIEATLNSCQITPLFTFPSDFTALTPGHFLVGESLMLPPEPYYVSNVALNRLYRVFQISCDSRFQHDIFKLGEMTYLKTFLNHII